MLSQRDADHVGGAASLLAQGLPHRRCEDGQTWVGDGVHFEVLHPLGTDHDGGVRPNTVSCVLRVQGQDGSVLLSGDIEATQEAALLQRHGQRLRAEMLLVTDRGSRTSSAPPFVDAVQPRVAVVQAAFRSRFGHPTPVVEARHAARGIPFVRSEACGAWTLPASGVPRCERQVARRYWHHPGAASATDGP